MSENRFIVFGIDEELYSMDLTYVRGIEEKYNIIPVPNCPQDIKGLISLRNDIIPVYSLRSRFCKDDYDEHGKLVLVSIRGTTIGFEVDYVKGIETIEDDGIMALPTVAKSEETAYIDCVINAASGIVINISVAHVLSDRAFDDITNMLDENQS